MRLFLLLIVLMSTYVHATSACDNVLTRAEKEPKADVKLAILGGCLAGPAPSKIHQQVALEMADISLHAGDIELVARYLEILRIMLDDSDKGD